MSVAPWPVGFWKTGVVGGRASTHNSGVWRSTSLQSLTAVLIKTQGHIAFRELEGGFLWGVCSPHSSPAEEEAENPRFSDLSVGMYPCPRVTYKPYLLGGLIFKGLQLSSAESNNKLVFLEHLLHKTMLLASISNCNSSSGNKDQEKGVDALKINKGNLN